MSSGKKGKKTKGKSVSLGEFLGTASSAGNAQVVVAPKTSWADECEEYEDDRYAQSERIVLPTAPRQARALDIDPDRVPSDPPFIAYVANLPFEVEDEDIERFFNKLNILKIRLPREGGETGRFKGFGYVEFATRSDLMEALALNDDMMRNRKIRVDIAEEDGSSRKIQSNRDRDEEREDRSGGVSDWRAAPRDSQSNRNGSDRSPVRGGQDDRFGDRDRDRGYGRDRFESRGGNRFGGSGGGRYDDRERRYDDRRQDDRRQDDRRQDDRRQDDRRQDDRRQDDRRQDDRRGGYRRDDYDRKDEDRWRRGGGAARERGDDDKESSMKERPKLNLKPRTKAVEEPVEDKVVSANPSIFGAAKPVDTAKKDLEIEKKYTGKKEQPPPPPKKEIAVPKTDIFGSAKPVDTAAKEREIEEKLWKRRKDGDGGKEPKDDHVESKRPSKIGDNKDRIRHSDNIESKEGSYRKERDHVDRRSHSNERDDDTHDENIESERNGDDEENKTSKNIENRKQKKVKKIKDEELIINTANKFSELGLDEEEA